MDTRRDGHNTSRRRVNWLRRNTETTGGAAHAEVTEGASKSGEPSTADRRSRGPNVLVGFACRQRVLEFVLCHAAPSKPILESKVLDASDQLKTN